METSKIKICGQAVKVGYCYATEIAFHNYAGVTIDKFDAENPQHTVYLIMAAIFAYYNSSSHESESHDLTDDSLLYEAAPSEIVEAIKTVLELRQRWYGIELPASQDVEEDSASDSPGGKN